MSNFDISSWGDFPLSDIFDKIEPCKCSKASDLPDGDDLYYLGAKKRDCCIIKRVSSVPELESAGNCIVLITDGDGSVGYANYVPFDKFIGTVNLVACYNNKHINKYTALFLVTVLDKERYKYSFGRKYKNSIPLTTIKLPITSKGCIDWDYMEKYMKERETIKFAAIKTTNNKSLPIAIDTIEFKMSDLFKVKGYGSISYTDIENKGHGEYPYITRTAKNNGVIDFFDYKTAPENSLTIETTLSGLCFYHNYEFSTGDHIMVLTPINGTVLNKYTAMYIKTIWRKNSYKYSYGRPAIKENIENTYLKLPAKDGKPNWDYMENYIKSLPYGDKI